MRLPLVVFATLIISFLLLSYKITQVPPGINGDEAGIGHNALLISRNLTDENSNFLPLFIFAKGSDWKQPVTVYTTAALFKVFGSSFFVLRATSIVFILLSLIILYFISRDYGGVKFFLFSSFLLVTTPIVMIQSHLALENIAPLPFVFFWLWAFRRRPALAGISLGIGLFSYLGMRLIVPILVLMTLAYFRRDVKKMAYFLLGVGPFLILLLVAYFRYPGAVFGNFNAPLSVSVYDFFYRYLSIFDLSFLFFTGDITPYHSTGRYGMLLLATLPLFILGAKSVLTGKNRFLKIILVSFFTAPLLYGLVPEVHRASRLLALLPFYTFLSAIGLKDLKKPVLVIFLLIMLVSYFDFARDYWFEYPKRVKEAFPIPIEKTHEFIVKE